MQCWAHAPEGLSVPSARSRSLVRPHDLHRLSGASACIRRSCPDGSSRTRAICVRGMLCVSCSVTGVTRPCAVYVEPCRRIEMGRSTVSRFPYRTDRLAARTPPPDPRGGPSVNVVRIHPHHAVLNECCQSVEATRRGSDHVVSEAVELGAVDRVLEPRRRSAVVDPLAEMRASRQECDRCSAAGRPRRRRAPRGAARRPWERTSLDRSDAHPSCARRPLGDKGSNNGEAEEERDGYDEGDEERTSPRRRSWRRHPLMVLQLLTKHKVSSSRMYVPAA